MPHPFKISSEELLDILALSPNATGIYAGDDIQIFAANDAMLAFWGKGREIIGKPMAEGVPELIGQPFLDIIRTVIRTGQDYSAKDAPAQLLVHGKLQVFYFDFLYKAVPRGDGGFYVLHTASDVTDRHLSDDKLNVLSGDIAALNYELTIANEKLIATNEELIEAQLESETQRLRLFNFIMQAPAGICVLAGENLVYELVNTAYQQILPGRSFSGRPIFEAVPELVGQPIEEILRNVYRTGIGQSTQELLVPLAEIEGGKMINRYFTFNYQALKNPEGKVESIIAFIYEVTEQVVTRRKMEESELHFRHLADLVPAKISNALPNGEVTFFNSKWLDYSGMSFEDLRDFGYHQMMHPDEILQFHAGLEKAAKSGIPFEMEMRFKDIYGDYRWHLNIASPVLDDNGKIRMWVGSTTDIQKLKEEEQRKGDFVSLLSHELKTPITSIKGHVQLMIRFLEGETDSPFVSKLRNSVTRVDKLIVQLTNLISDMLDLTRIESGRLDLHKEPTALDEIVGTVVEDFQLTHPDHVLNLNIDATAIVDIDRNKIVQVLVNFISNAIKYAPKSKQVDINVFLDKNGHAGVSVRDYGIGISKEEQTKIFERFYRVEGKAEYNFSGFGIGLFIAQNIIKMHGGIISIDSEKGNGATFTFILPTT